VLHDYERYTTSLNAEDDLDEGASYNAKLRHATSGHRPSQSVKSKRWKREVTFQRAMMLSKSM
jgi:hypothetical protein